ncbi:MAG: helicase C-terminal domain-containing protein [Candidatus Bathyarchaeia archaeon]
MAVYICRKCARPHSLQEFRESRFCRSCGKLLTYREKKKLSNLEVKKSEEPQEEGFIALFPYSPYPQQLEFMEDAKRVLGSRGVLVSEACNGFGKTVCALSVALSLGRKVVYATRTHEQVRQVLHELDQINLKAGAEFSAVSLASRQNLCLNTVCRRLPPLEAVETCNILRKAGRCPYRSSFNFGFPNSYLPPVLSVRRLRKIGKSRSYCPYFLARRVAEDCSVVVAPYQYIFNEAIRTKVKLEISGKILIFDEAHNADKVGQEALSDVLSERSLNIAKRELELLDAPSTFIDELKNYIDDNVSAEPMVKDGSDLRADLEDLLDEEISTFVDLFDPVVDEIRLYKIKRDLVPVCYLNGVLNFISLVGSSKGESYAAIYRRSRRGLNLIEYRCLDPSLAIMPVIEEAYSALIMSGTLSPLRLFADVIGIQNAQAKTYSAIAKPENIRTFIDTTVTTRFKQRSSGMLRSYGERISKLIPNVPNGVLIFFPQRGLMLEALRNWAENGILKKRGGKLYFYVKKVFVEGDRASQNAKIVDEYREAARKEGGAVLFAVFRGRNAEGSNFPYEEARGIFLVGLPYADYRDPVVKAQIRYFNKRHPRLGERWYVMDAFRAANQAMGRGIRHGDDWCNFFLMDKRYASYWRFISKWAREGGIEKIE